MTELLTALGIIIVIAGVAVPFYMSHFETARIGQISLTATEYFKAMEACLLINNEDLSKCNTKTKIKFDCDECSEMRRHSAYGGRVYDRFGITLNKDNLSACIIHRKDCTRKRKVTLNKKLCHSFNSAGWTCFYGAEDNSSASLPVLPLKECSSDSDCGGGQTCAQKQGIRNAHGGCI